MRLGAILLLLFSGAIACTEETSHADPVCAFDETGCIPLGARDRRRPGWGATDRRAHGLITHGGVEPSGTPNATPDLGGEPGRIAPEVHLSLSGGVERAELRIPLLRQDGGLEVVERVELGPDPQTLRLDGGMRYILRLRVPSSETLFSLFTIVP